MTREEALYPVDEVKHLYATVIQLREALAEAQSEAEYFRNKSRSSDELLMQVGAVLHCAGRAMRGEASSSDVVLAGFDCAPMRNLMSTVYGLTPLGGDKPVRSTRKRK